MEYVFFFIFNKISQYDFNDQDFFVAKQTLKELLEINTQYK